MPKKIEFKLEGEGTRRLIIDEEHDVRDASV